MLILYKKKKFVSISPTQPWKVISAYLLSVEYAKYLPLGEYTEHLTGSVGLASQSVNNKGGFKKKICEVHTTTGHPRQCILELLSAEKQT